jgi:hypothetical protein
MQIKLAKSNIDAKSRGARDALYDCVGFKWAKQQYDKKFSQVNCLTKKEVYNYFSKRNPTR